MSSNEREEGIDLRHLVRVFLERRAITFTLIGVCTVIALCTSLLLPKTWESSALVQMRSAGKDLSNLSAMASMMGLSVGGGSSSASPTNYIELMKSRAVLDPVIDSLTWEDSRAKPDAAGFAKSNLDIQNTKQTNLIIVKAKGKSPEEAQQIAKGVIDNFLLLQTAQNKETQSVLADFLETRIQDVRKESDEAAKAFAAYQTEHQIYAPEEQVAAAIKSLESYDEAITQANVAQKKAEAEYSSASQKLGEEKAKSLAYQINDNTTVQSLRQQIASAEVGLVGLKQKYTEKHPDVLQAEENLATLRKLLSEEVQAVVLSDSMMTGTSSALLSIVLSSAVQADVASASVTALEKKRGERQKELGEFPANIVEYMRLASDAKIKLAVHESLVQQNEQTKIQKAMESLDIQVVDAPNLPQEDRPAGPRKKLITLIGFVVGVVLAFGYSLAVYRRECA